MVHDTPITRCLSVNNFTCPVCGVLGSWQRSSLFSSGLNDVGGVRGCTGDVGCVGAAGVVGISG